VNEVVYQQGEYDEFRHHYYYDADNRLIATYTSKNGIIWEKESKQFYYAHGPVARVELGDKQVQGTDYAYTILGWIKGVNSNTLDKDRDLGKDGSTAAGNLNRWFGYDAAAYSLGYFTNDYKSINASLNNSTSWFLASETNDATNGYKQDSYDLYNGNISRMVTSLRDQNGAPIPVQGRTFRYDQLNRIKEVHAWTDAQLIATNNWSTANATDNNGNYAERFEYDLNGNIELAVREGHLTGTHQHMDNIIYNYVSGTNKLDNVNDVGTALSSDYDMDIDGGQTSGNYGYDAIGNLTSDVSEDIQNIEWNNQGKIVKITRTNTSNKEDLEFLYDAAGQRIAKIVKPRVGGTLQPENKWVYTIYSRDAAGNVLAVYNYAYKQLVGSNWQIVYDLKEQHIYSGSRLGLNYDQQSPVTSDFSGSVGTDGTFNLAAFTFSTVIVPAVSTNELKRQLGYKTYELTNHLGNVLATVSDRRIPVGSGNLIVNFLPEIFTYTDYFVFGAAIPGRSFVSASGKYRYGFNGLEKNSDCGCDGITYSAEARDYDARVGRWITKDPLSILMPWETPYSFSNNMPIIGSDKDGRFCIPCIVILTAAFMTVPEIANTPGTNPAVEKERWQKANMIKSTWFLVTVSIAFAPALIFEMPALYTTVQTATSAAASQLFITSGAVYSFLQANPYLLTELGSAVAEIFNDSPVDVCPTCGADNLIMFGKFIIRNVQTALIDDIIKRSIHIDIGGYGKHEKAINFVNTPVDDAGKSIPNLVLGRAEETLKGVKNSSVDLITIESGPINANIFVEATRVLKPGGTINVQTASLTWDYAKIASDNKLNILSTRKFMQPIYSADGVFVGEQEMLEVIFQKDAAYGQ
jgi:RHS repeat-associated protein